MAKRNRQNRTLPVKAGMFSNYSQWWLSGGDLSQIAGAALLFSDTPHGRIQASLFNVWAANCISARAETLASVDLKLYRKSDDQDEDDEEIIKHPVLDLLEEVNPINLQKTSFREQIERQLSIHGDCYVHKVRGANGKPSEMYILPAQFVEPIPDAMRLVAGYRYQTSTVLSAQDIIRIYYPSDENPILARSPMTSAISAINNYSLSDLAQQGIDRRGGQGGGIVMVDFNTISGDPQRFMQEWDATRSDPRNAGRDAFLPTDSNYQSGTLTAQQQQREERATRLIREIMAALRVPPSLAGDYKDASVLANAAQQSKNFWETLMLFEIKRIEEALNIGLLWAEFKGSKEEGLYLKHDLTTVGALSEGEDVEVNRNQIKATTADTAFASGIISLNEARIYIGQEPIDDERADEVLQPEIAEEVGEAPLEDVELEEASEMDALLEEVSAVKAKDMDGDGFVFDNTSKERPATAEERTTSKNKGSAMLEKAKARAAKKVKKGGKGKKPAKTEEQKAAEKEQKHQEKVKAQVAQIDDYTGKLQAELERLTALGDSFKDESNLRKRLGQAVKRLKAKKERLLNSKSNVDAGAEELISEAGTKALPEPFEDSTWVGFYLSTHDALALEDKQLEGEREDRLHLTLAMLRTLTHEERAQIVGQLSEISESFKPMSVQTDGVGVFNLPDSDCVHVKVTGNDLHVFRTAVEQALKPYLDEQHAYNPHITLAYCPKGTDVSAIEVPNLTLNLPMLTFSEGTRNWNFGLGYGFAGVQDWADAIEEDEPVKSVPFFDFVGMLATFEGKPVGTIEAIKRFGEYEGIKATKENPVAVIDGKPYASSDIEVLINE